MPSDNVREIKNDYIYNECVFILEGGLKTTNNQHINAINMKRNIYFGYFFIYREILHQCV